ncbi:MAG: hypothetical protein A2X47_01075 [Lentisphaerae bacterium GWF2_38_69]|nr:MAG: hypothetical protein A2X47_01075 [Lentisphaerae bacterium GWF2_38_69]
MEKFILSLYDRKNRYEANQCVCEGLRASQELYSITPELIEYAVVTNKADSSFLKGIKIFEADERVFNKISSTVSSQGILLVAKIPKLSDRPLQDTPFALVLDRIADPGNFGTILRTCVSVGLKDVWFSSTSVDPYSEKTIRSALCAQFSLNLHAYNNVNTLVDNLEKEGFQRIYRTDPSGGKNCFETGKLFEKSIIVFGNEANGISDVKDSIPVNIPMPGKFESLNVAQAVTVILFEAVRRKILR